MRARSAAFVAAEENLAGAEQMEWDEKDLAAEEKAEASVSEI